MNNFFSKLGAIARAIPGAIATSLLGKPSGRPRPDRRRRSKLLQACGGPVRGW